MDIEIFLHRVGNHFECAVPSKMCQRQQLHSSGLHFHAALHRGKDDKNIIDLTVIVQLQHPARDMSRSSQCRFLCRVMEMLVNRYVFMLEISPSDFADDEQLVVSSRVEVFFGHLQNIVIVASGKSFVRGYTDNRAASRLALQLVVRIQIRMVKLLRKMAEHSVEHGLQSDVIRFRRSQRPSRVI